MCFLNNDRMQSKKTTFRNDRAMKDAIFHDFFVSFLPKFSSIVTMATSIEHDDLCINYLLSHQNTPHRKILRKPETMREQPPL